MVVLKPIPTAGRLQMPTAITADKQKLKSLEKAYWDAYAAHDEELVLSMVPKKDFLGCSSSGKLLTRDGLQKKVAGDDSKKTVLQLKPKIEDFHCIIVESTAITLSLVSRPDGKTIITHTWIRNDNDWIMIGGMSQSVADEMNKISQ